jgi:structural maintenance of chromosome 4
MQLVPLRLGDLGAIDKKYDVAVSTACAALDYIVVETTADAQACVAHLRTNNLGGAVQVHFNSP